MDELEHPRKAGYAVNDGESEDDLAAVGALVVDTRGAAHGAISISDPKERVRANRERCAEMVRQTAHDLERKLCEQPCGACEIRL